MKETKFKQTDIGPIPEDWEVKSLGEIGNVQMCKRIFKDQTSESTGVPFYKIGTFGKIADAFISVELFQEYKSKYNFPHKGDLLLSAAGTIGRVVEFNGEDSYFQDSNIIWLSHNEDKITNKFLKYIYLQNKWQTEDGGIVTRLYNKDFLATKIICPDKNEQEKVSNTLDDIENLIESLDKLIEKKRMIKQGTMQQLLTGRRRLPGFTQPWVKKTLGDILEYEQPQKFIVKSTEYVSNGIPVLTAGKSFILGYTTEKFGVYTSLPVIIFDDFTTDCKFVTFPFKAKSSAMKMLKLKSQEYDIRLIFEIIRRIGYVPGDHQRHWIKIFSDFTITIPSTLNEQQAIAKVLTDMDNEIVSLTHKRDKYVAIKSGMMQQLLTGKIRLI